LYLLRIVKGYSIIVISFLDLFMIKKAQ